MTHPRRSSRFRLLPLCLLTLLAASIILPIGVGTPRATGLAAQPTPLFAVSAVAAFGGIFKVGEWLPVLVTIENTGPDTHVEVRATVGPSDGATTFVAPVELPAGSKKRVTLYTLPEALPRTFDVLVVERDGEAVARASVKINPLFPTDTLCGAGGYKGGSLAALGRVQPAGAGVGGRGDGAPAAPVTVAPVDLATFPTAPEGLYSFDCLVIGGSEGFATLGPDQQAALATWVHHGGQLVVAGGERWQAAVASVPPDLLPVAVDGSRSIDDLSGLAALAASAPPNEPVVVATARPREDVTGVGVVAATGDLPLVVERPIGRGLVTFLAFDPAAAPFATWDGMEGLWQGILRRMGDLTLSGMPPDLNPRRMETAPLVGALSQIPALDLPSMGLLIALLGAYIAAISPVNYLVLRRLNRLSWAWATTLVLVALFAAGAYGLGARIRGNDVIVNRIEVLQTDGTTGGPAFARSYVGLFSPSKASYQVRVGGPGDEVLLSSMPPSTDPWATYAGGGGGTVVQGQPAVVRDLGVAQWASRFFMAEHHPTGGPRVVADLRFEDEMLVGTVANPTDVPLDDCAIFVGFQVFLLGELGPGEEKAVSFRLGASTASALNPSGMPLSMLLLGANPRGAWPETVGDREFRVRQTILDALFGYSFAGPNLPAGVNFVGWADQGSTPIVVAGRKVATVDTVLLQARLPVSFGEARVSVPPGIAAFGLYRSDAESAYVSGTELQVYNGSAEFEASLPAEARPDRVLSLTIHLPNPGMMGPPPKEIAVYDWQAGRYVAVEAGGGAIALEQPDRFFDPDRGLVRVRLTADINQPVWTSMALSLTGERVA